MLGNLNEPPRAPQRRGGRRGQAHRRPATGTAAVVILLALGISLLAIVVAQAAFGVGPLGSSAAADRPVITLVVPTPRPQPASLEVQAPSVALAAPPTAKPLASETALADLVRKYLGDQRGEFGVAIKDLDTGQGVLVNADREFPAASLFKLSVMYEIYRQRDAGRLALADLVPLSANYARQDLGTLDVPVDTLVSVGWALDRMVTRSDNATANLLLDKAGAANVNSSMRDLGLQETRITGEQLTTSARDMLHLMEVLATEQGLKKDTDVEMIQTLLGQTVNDRLPAQLPRDTPVAHKTGNLDGIVHDVGIVYSPSATLVFALLAADVPNGNDVTRAEAALTRAVYDYFNAPGSPRTRSIFRAPDASKRPTPVPPFLPPGGSVSGTPLPPGGSVSGTSLPTVGTSSVSTPNLTPAPRVTSPPQPTSAAVATSGRAEAPTVAPPEPARAITAVRPTAVPPPTEPVPSAASAPATTAPAVAPPTTAPAIAPAITAVRPTAVPPPAAPAEAARPIAATPVTAPAAPAATAPRAPEIPRFGQSTPTAR